MMIIIIIIIIIIFYTKSTTVLPFEERKISELYDVAIKQHE